MSKSVIDLLNEIPGFSDAAGQGNSFQVCSAKGTVRIDIRQVDGGYQAEAYLADAALGNQRSISNVEQSRADAVLTAHLEQTFAHKN